MEDEGEAVLTLKECEDIRTGENPWEIRQAILDNLCFIQGRIPALATKNDWYMSVAYAVRDRMMHRWVKTTHLLHDKRIKIVGYLSAEFLMGPHLGNALINLGIQEQVSAAVRQLGLDLNDLLVQEAEPGLGNGGLGRLAACYLDSLSMLKIASIGYGIRYEFGIFDQEIRDGWQVEVSDKWLRLGNPWEIARPEIAYYVKLGGRTEPYDDDQGRYRVRWVPSHEIKGVAYDTPIPGYRNDAVNLLRLWKSEAVESFDFQAFNVGNYYGAVHEKMLSETISKVLYPNDDPDVGKKLRLAQQYFFVSCALQDIIRIHKLRRLSMEHLHESVAFQLNDTDPAIAVAELMRLLIDEHLMEWDDAWVITRGTFSYTNHTLLPEALGKWSLPLFRSVLPRHLEIIYEINGRFLNEVRAKYPGQEDRLACLSIIDEAGEKYVRMAHLASVGSHAINGVAALHSELLKHDFLRHFYELAPEKFLNVTNGVTPRRWMVLYNPRLSDLITRSIGDGWMTRLEEELRNLEKFVDDTNFQHEWQAIKHQNKSDLAAIIKQRTGIVVSPDTLFDIHVKRLHEYKRQHLNVLHVVALYSRIKRNRGLDMTPRTIIFGGKAAPGYFMARLIIKLINSVAEVVNNDPDVAGRLRVVFLPDFNVKNSQWVYRAADLSEQISTAGKEASGTGNMKFAMNGALTIGTLDGANVEIREEVGPDNFFLFGLTSERVNDMKLRGYDPRDCYHSNGELREIIDLISSGFFSKGDGSLFKPLIGSLINRDEYMVLADYQAYVDCQEVVSETYLDRTRWTRMSILNVARMGKFSSDRAIREYCEKIWHVKPVQGG